jgi:hypothetical protein
LTLANQAVRGEHESLADFSTFTRFLAKDALNDAAVLGLDASNLGLNVPNFGLHRLHKFVGCALGLGLTDQPLA